MRIFCEESFEISEYISNFGPAEGLNVCENRQWKVFPPTAFPSIP